MKELHDFARRAVEKGEAHIYLNALHKNLHTMVKEDFYEPLCHKASVLHSESLKSRRDPLSIQLFKDRTLWIAKIPSCDFCDRLLIQSTDYYIRQNLDFLSEDFESNMAIFRLLTQRSVYLFEKKETS
ncbi:unnamed protein product [Caenorhabditis auriculariae]|uniref:Uncharacterized protein n=1 Tax=Caenorhabditis auriculariae TaxID=2777116 RepID=A0A8S1HHQ7_9PELO|nr:unnamed protein product [Caenorhabditis auriculariae]